MPRKAPPVRIPSVPLARAFSHRDCRHKQPLHDALSSGFTSFEADVWLVKGQLLVGHDFGDLRPGRTLEELYLKPLLDYAQQNGGKIYPGWPHSVQLLIDVKSGSESTYQALHKLLDKYKQILTTFSGGAAQEGAVTVVVSGNRSRRLMQPQDPRYAGFDGRVPDLGDGAPASFSPAISSDWGEYFKWEGKGGMPDKERQKLHSMVKAAHANGQRVRFWATPEKDPKAREAVWRELVAAGVDYINTDSMTALRDWLLLNDPQPSAPVTPWFTQPSGPLPERETYENTSAHWFLNRRGPLSRHWRLHAKKTLQKSAGDSGRALGAAKKKLRHPFS
jgi:hypothetical protein